MLKKVVSSFLIFFFLFTTVFARPVAAAQPTWYHTDFSDYIRKVDDPSNPEDIYAERYTAAQVQWVIYGYFAWIFNSIFGPDLGYCIMSTNFGAIYGAANAGIFLATCSSELEAWINDKKVAFSNFQASENTQQPTATHLFNSNRQLSGVTYFKERLNKFGLVQEARAADPGFGFTAAEPIQKLWVAARNVSYFFIVLAIVVISFMIMFRVKTSPQAIITIQSALPKIIVGIVAITFSYAIAGLMIDLMYVVTGLMATLLINSGMFEYGATEWQSLYSEYMTMSGFKMGYVFFMYYMLFFISVMTSWMAIIVIITGPFGAILMFAAVPLILIIISSKVIWALLKNFVTILLLIAAGPFYILGGVIGGGGFTGWLKKLAACLAVYPVAAIMFAFSFLFLANSMGVIGQALASTANDIPFKPDAQVLQDGVWLPPMTGIAGLNSVWLVVSLIILSLVPKVTDLISSAMSGKPFAYGTAVGEAIGAGGAVGMGGLSYASAAQQASYKKITDTGGTPGGLANFLNTVGTIARGASGGRLK